MKTEHYATAAMICAGIGVLFTVTGLVVRIAASGQPSKCSIENAMQICEKDTDCAIEVYKICETK